ncbi:hypothetical protein [Tamlana sp. I1]|uniref:hypothetical protein n=1 Tax=Tamlana sp. I1 TaxID=2762061 RepID=UPI00188E211F|nr:hypothetical protein [Tamlana sp. I1]
MPSTKTHTQTIKMLFLMFSWMLIACGTTKTVNPETLVIADTNKIIFLTYSISEDPSGKRTLTFIKQNIVEGKLKPNSSWSVENAQEGDLICAQLNKNSNIISTRLIKNPLKKHVESFHPSGNIEITTINQDKTQFSVRLALHSQTSIITISNFADRKSLISTKINLE